MAKSSIWTEKYRPSTFKEIRGQEKIVERAEAFVKQKNMPHLLFSGPAGVGKTTLALVIAKTLFGDSWPENLLELNASVTGDTPILIRKNGEVIRTNFEELESLYFDKNDTDRKIVDDLEILSIGKKDLKVKFSKVGYIFRHKVGKTVNIKYEGGKIKTSLNHSIIIFDEEGNLVKKECKYLKKGDLLITFKTDFKGIDTSIKLKKYKEMNLLKSGLIRNPKINHNFEELMITNEIAWLLGLYTAEGCTSLRNGTSGQIIYTLGYPQEQVLVNKIQNIFSNLNISFSTGLGKSGFDRSKESSIQVRAFSTQLTKFLNDNFYITKNERIAKNKKFLSHIFQANKDQKLTFLKGYFDGDGYGKWGKLVRISSRSKDALIDTVWLGKLSGVEASFFDTEARLIWENNNFSYIKSNLIPSNIIINILKDKKDYSNENLKYLLRHQLYSKKSKRVKKETVKRILGHIKDSEVKERLRKIVNSDLFVLKINDIKVEDYDDYVYDVSVPEGQMFFGGTNPILLHNSDERGIDIVRNKVKDFARTKTIGNFPFKIIYLDECDSLTKEAQQALRRTMENYSATCRFILSCNYSSKIIDPIQSRCTIFRFKPLNEKDVSDMIKQISKNEKFKVDDNAIKVLYSISNGDLRKVENILQSSVAINKNVNEDLIFEIASAAKPKEIDKILENSIKGNFVKARDLLLDVMLKHGLSGLDMIKYIQGEIWNLKIDDDKKMKMIEKCGEIEFRMVEGSDEFLQLETLLASFILLGK